MAEQFKTERKAVAWLQEIFGAVWTENTEDGRYGACVAVDGKDDPVFAYGDTVLETVNKLAEAIEV